MNNLDPQAGREPQDEAALEATSPSSSPDRLSTPIADAEPVYAYQPETPSFEPRRLGQLVIWG